MRIKPRSCARPRILSDSTSPKVSGNRVKISILIAAHPLNEFDLHFVFLHVRGQDELLYSREHILSAIHHVHAVAGIIQHLGDLSDALAVGITFALLPDVNIWIAIGSIGVITLVLSSVGVKIGAIFGAKYKRVAELCGGIVLVAMGIKILIEHLTMG